MGTICKIMLRELKKNKFHTFLTFIICIIAMNTIFSAITNATSAIYQKKQFEENIGVDLEHVLHLHYRKNEETIEFANILSNFKDYLRQMDGVTAEGQFDDTEFYFSGIYDIEQYKSVNIPQYEGYPLDLSWVVTIDEEILNLVKGGLTEYAETKSGYPPIYPSEIFKESIPIGTVLTVKYIDEVKYEVVGYIPNNSKWVNSNDIIRYPFISLNGAFVASYTEWSKTDLYTQLACMHNTYIYVSENANIEKLKQEIHNYTVEHGFDAYAETLKDEFALYVGETECLTKAQTALAIFISALSITSMVAVFITNVLLKRTQYGIMIANGFTIHDISLEIAMEIGSITFSSAAIMWVYKLIELQSSENLSIKLFRDILLKAHIRFTLPICIVVVLVLSAISTLLPTLKVIRYKPCELIGDDIDGND